MIQFDSDYTNGAHPAILERLLQTNTVQTIGYGEDEYCRRAAEKIRKLCRREDAAVRFFVGGTQTNLTVISALLRPYQGVLSAETGHINVHESGAIEATGHKVLALPSRGGKITAEQVIKAYKQHWSDANHAHMVQPGMVYVSHPTENGTTYTRQELYDLRDACKECGLPLYLDGARLGYAMAAAGNDITFADLAACCDAFYIGGTKVGALFGEALVITNELLKRDSTYLMKQRGALLAKGRLLGIQFDVLLEDGLYTDIAAHAVSLALRIRAAFEEKGITMRYDSDTNQQFPILPNEWIHRLSTKYSFTLWEAMDAAHTVVRFCTSWSTAEADVNELLADISAL